MHHKKLKFQKIEFLSLEESVQFPGTGLKTQSSKIIFETKTDLSKCAHEVVNKQSFKLFSGKTQKTRHVLQMRILKIGASFNSESSVIIQKLNEKCTEVDMI